MSGNSTKPESRDEPARAFGLEASWLVTFSLLALSIGLVFYRFGLPFSLDQSPLRILWAQRPAWDILLNPWVDPRIPQLLFLLVHLSTTLLGTSEAAACLPIALCAVASVVVVHRMTLQTFSPLTALFSSLLLILNLSFLSEARSVAWTPVFLFLSLVSLWSWLDLLEQGCRNSAVLYVASSAAMNYASFFGPLILIVELAYLFALPAFRRERSRVALKSLGAVLLCAMPALWHALNRGLSHDLYIICAARVFPSALGQAVGFWEYGSLLREVLLPPDAAGRLAMIAAVASGVFCSWRQPAPPRRLWALWALLPAALIWPLTEIVRLQTYYLLFLLPALAPLAFSGLEWAVARALGSAGRQVRTAVMIVLACVLLLSYGRATWGQRFRIWDSAVDMRALVEHIQSHKDCRTVVFEPRFLNVIFLYYAYYEDPRFTQEAPACVATEACEAGEWSLMSLVDQDRLGPDWGQESVSRLKALQARSHFWYVDHTAFPNPEFRRRFADRCRMKGDYEGLDLYYCPQEGTAAGS